MQSSIDRRERNKNRLIGNFNLLHDRNIHSSDNNVMFFSPVDKDPNVKLSK